MNCPGSQGPESRAGTSSHTHTRTGNTHARTHTQVHTHQSSPAGQPRVLPTRDRPPLPGGSTAPGMHPPSPPAGGRCGWHPPRPSARWSPPGPGDRKCHGGSILDHSLSLRPTLGPAVLRRGRLLPIWLWKEWPSRTTAKGAAAAWTDSLVSCMTSGKSLNPSEPHCACLQTGDGCKACFAGLLQEGEWAQLNYCYDRYSTVADD